MLERLVRADEKETREGMGRAKVDHEEAGERVEEEEEKEMEGGGRQRDGTTGTRARERRWKRAKVSIVKRMEAKKENYIKKLERSRSDDTRLLVAGYTGMRRVDRLCSSSFRFLYLFVPLIWPCCE